jgi:hypothetical protein
VTAIVLAIAVKVVAKRALRLKRLLTLPLGGAVPLGHHLARNLG